MEPGFLPCISASRLGPTPPFCCARARAPVRVRLCACAAPVLRVAAAARSLMDVRRARARARAFASYAAAGVEAGPQPGLEAGREPAGRGPSARRLPGPDQRGTRKGCTAVTALGGKWLVRLGRSSSGLEAGSGQARRCTCAPWPGPPPCVSARVGSCSRRSPIRSFRRRCG